MGHHRPQHDCTAARAHPGLALIHVFGTVLALLPLDVHQHVAAQQEHVPHLPPQVGVRQRAEAGARHAGPRAARGAIIAITVVERIG